MDRDRRLLAGVWLLSTLLFAGGALAAYHFATRLPGLAGRGDPAALYSDPTLLFTDPGLLGTAVEVRVTEAVRACMAGAGLTFRGPAAVDGLDGLLNPARDGYGIAAGPPVGSPRLGGGGPDEAQRAAYEEALYGSALGDAEGEAAGCAAAGRAALDSALALLGALPYSIAQLEADAAAHPAYVDALGRWSDCMAGRGYPAASPESLVAAQAAALATASGDEARALADRERLIAAADAACRAGTLDPAVREVAADLGPHFVEANRAQLEALIPPPGDGAGEGLGAGDVQVTLRWASTVDLDLSVADPAGSLVSYRQRRVPSGGQLDRDANYPCASATGAPVENVFWPPGGAPAGAYQATVSYRTACATAGTQSYELIVRVDGVVAQQVQATIEPGQEITLEFAYEGA